MRKLLYISILLEDIVAISLIVSGLRHVLILILMFRCASISCLFLSSLFLLLIIVIYIATSCDSTISLNPGNPDCIQNRILLRLKSQNILQNILRPCFCLLWKKNKKKDNTLDIGLGRKEGPTHYYYHFFGLHYFYQFVG